MKMNLISFIAIFEKEYQSINAMTLIKYLSYFVTKCRKWVLIKLQNVFAVMFMRNGYQLPNHFHFFFLRLV